jgi:hypothetical protein
MFRPRLFHIKDEDALRDYFCENAGYNKSTQTYQCAGCISDTPEGLFKKLKKEWQEDKKNFEENELPTLAKASLEGHKIHTIYRKYFHE